LPESDVPRKVVADVDRGAVQTAIGLLERERTSGEGAKGAEQGGKKQEEKGTETRSEEEGKHEKGVWEQ
jgi:hypothetical protein